MFVKPLRCDQQTTAATACNTDHLQMMPFHEDACGRDLVAMIVIEMIESEQFHDAGQFLFIKFDDIRKLHRFFEYLSGEKFLPQIHVEHSHSRGGHRSEK